MARNFIQRLISDKARLARWLVILSYIFTLMGFVLILYLLFNGGL